MQLFRRLVTRAIGQVNLVMRQANRPDWTVFPPGISRYCGDCVFAQMFRRIAEVQVWHGSIRTDDLATAQIFAAAWGRQVRWSRGAYAVYLPLSIATLVNLNTVQPLQLSRWLDRQDALVAVADALIGGGATGGSPAVTQISDFTVPEASHRSGSARREEVLV